MSVTQSAYRGQLMDVPLENITLNTKEFTVRPVKTDSDKFKELMRDIQARGLQQPVTLRRLKGPDGQYNGYFGLIAGLHRVTVFKLLKEPKIPALVIDAEQDEVLERGFAENIQRVDMKPSEQSDFLRRWLQSHDVTRDDIAKKYNKSLAWVNQRLGIASLPSKGENGEEPDGGIDIKELVDSKKITTSNAAELARLWNEDPPSEVWSDYVAKAQQLGQTEFRNDIQVRINDIKEKRKQGKRTDRDLGIRVPKMRSLAELQTHLERIEKQAGVDDAQGKPVSDRTRTTIDVLKFVLQIDDASWEKRQEDEKKRKELAEKKKQDRLAGPTADSLALAGLDSDE